MSLVFYKNAPIIFTSTIQLTCDIFHQLLQSHRENYVWDKIKKGYLFIKLQQQTTSASLLFQCILTVLETRVNFIEYGEEIPRRSLIGQYSHSVEKQKAHSNWSSDIFGNPWLALKGQANSFEAFQEKGLLSISAECLLWLFNS